MSDDLVKRLRKGVMCGDDPIVDEAADRIEKLEAALRELSEDWACCAVSKAMRDIARKALEGKDE